MHLRLCGRKTVELRYCSPETVTEKRKLHAALRGFGELQKYTFSHPPF
jgi:hypothetical protein